jgi:hypothetical protein
VLARANGRSCFTDEAMVKKIWLLICVPLVLVIATSTVFASPLGVAGHIQLNAVPESWSLMLLGSVLISGATVLRRRWSSPGK